MQPVPQKVKNVSVYPYINWPHGGGVGPELLPVIIGASGTYAIGTLTTNIFYNLNLTDAVANPPLQVHGKYWAIGEYENGGSFRTPMMLCLEAGVNPEFGQTVSMLKPGVDVAEPTDLSVPPYVKLTQLNNVTVTYIAPAPIILQETLISDATGYIIATKVGTPHLMGVQVDGGNRSANLKLGLKDIIVTGTTPDGQRITRIGLTCVGAGDPAIFLQTFP